MKKIAVSGGKGGTGKTLCSINLGLALAKKRKKVVLFDADLQLANMDIALNIAPEKNLQSVVYGQASLREILTPGPNGIRVVTGGSALQGLMNAGPKRMATFMDDVDSLASDTDFVIFDTGAGVDNRVMAFLKAADEVILVTTPDPTSVTDAYATLKVLWKKDASKPVSVLVNLVADSVEARGVYNTLCEIADKYLGNHPKYAGFIPQDSEAARSIRLRNPVLVANPRAESSVSFLTIADSIKAA